jgi:hypothetical protein
MRASEPAQRDVGERLDPDRHAVDAGSAERGQPLALERARIDLERHLAGLARKRRAHGVEQRAHALRREQRGRAAAQVDRGQAAAREVARARAELLAQRRDVAILLRALERARGHDGKVAVGADPLAERHVQVDADVAHRRQLAASVQRSDASGTMAGP